MPENHPLLAREEESPVPRSERVNPPIGFATEFRPFRERIRTFVANCWIVSAVSVIFGSGDEAAHDWNCIYRLILCSGLVASLVHAQQSCVNSIRVMGTITDPTGAVIPGAQVHASNGETATTDTAGHYVLPCIPATSTTLTAQVDGFAKGGLGACSPRRDRSCESATGRLSSPNGCSGERRFGHRQQR